MRKLDGSAGDADYGVIGPNYSRFRRPEPRIAEAVRWAIGSARSVVNVGAGAGSYEPQDLDVTAVEPSGSMRAQRHDGGATAIDAAAEELPFADDSFDAAMSTFSVHQWNDLHAGLCEMRRVSRGPVVILTCDPDQSDRFWLAEYAPEVTAVAARRFPILGEIVDNLPGAVVEQVPIPRDCADCFAEAYYARPEKLLNPAARRANSGWSFVGPEVHARFEHDLRRDLDDGTWDARHGHLREQPEFHGSLVLIRTVHQS